MSTIKTDMPLLAREYRCRYQHGSKELIFLNELIDGWAREVPIDPERRTLMLNWFRPDMPHIYS